MRVTGFQMMKKEINLHKIEVVWLIRKRQQKQQQQVYTIFFLYFKNKKKLVHFMKTIRLSGEDELLPLYLNVCFLSREFYVNFLLD